MTTKPYDQDNVRFIRREGDGELTVVIRHDDLYLGFNEALDRQIDLLEVDVRQAFPLLLENQSLIRIATDPNDSNSAGMWLRTEPGQVGMIHPDHYRARGLVPQMTGELLTQLNEAAHQLNYDTVKPPGGKSTTEDADVLPMLFTDRMRRRRQEETRKYLQETRFLGSKAIGDGELLLTVLKPRPGNNEIVTIPDAGAVITKADNNDYMIEVSYNNLQGQVVDWVETTFPDNALRTRDELFKEALSLGCTEVLSEMEYPDALLALLYDAHLAGYDMNGLLKVGYDRLEALKKRHAPKE